MRCDLEPQDCVADHLCPKLDARPQPSGGWRGHCPAHRDDQSSLSIDVGSRGARVVLKCFAGCTYPKIRDAMIRSGVNESCLPKVRSRPAATRTEEAEKLARIEQWMANPPTRPQVMLVELGMMIWDCDRHAAAAKLEIGWRTAYRARDS